MIAFFALLAALSVHPIAPVLSPPGDLCAQRDSLRSLFPSLDGGADLEVLALLFPGGYGGVTTTYFFLKQPAFADSVRRMARTLSSCPHDQKPRLWMILQTVPVRQGDYDGIELRKWFAALLKIPWDGVELGGIDEGQNRLHYGFLTQTALDAFRAGALALGVPPKMLALEIERIDLVRPPSRLSFDTSASGW
jgi:hypothetical protein